MTIPLNSREKKLAQLKSWCNGILIVSLLLDFCLIPIANGNLVSDAVHFWTTAVMVALTPLQAVSLWSLHLMKKYGPERK